MGAVQEYVPDVTEREVRDAIDHSAVPIELRDGHRVDGLHVLEMVGK